MKILCQKHIYKILTIAFVLTFPPKMRADGNTIPISDEVVLVVQIALVLIAVGLAILFAFFVRKFAKKRNSSVAKTFGIIGLIILLPVAYYWWKDYKHWHPNVNRDADGAPEKFSWVPEDAFWINDDLGGKWYMVQDVDSISKTAFFKMYHGITGAEIGGDKYVLFCQDSTAKINWANLKKEIGNGDGTYITLKRDDCYFRR